jgi:hypothetical protein
MSELAVMLEAVEKYMGEQFTEMLEEAVTDARYAAHRQGWHQGHDYGWSHCGH